MKEVTNMLIAMCLFWFLLPTIKYLMACVLKQSEETQVHGNSHLTVTRLKDTLHCGLFVSLFVVFFFLNTFL